MELLLRTPSLDLWQGAQDRTDRVHVGDFVQPRAAMQLKCWEHGAALNELFRTFCTRFFNTS